MTEANGLPLSVVVAGANTHDIKRVADTPDALRTGKPGKRLRLCMDKGYEAQWLDEYLKSHRYEPHTRSRTKESEAVKGTVCKAHRRVVERTHSRMNRYRRVLTRQEKKFENYEAMLHLVCAVIVRNKILLGQDLNLTAIPFTGCCLPRRQSLTVI